MNSGMTENQLAKISGFTRSYIALMKNGQRVSADMERMKRLLQALNLSVAEYNLTWEAYIQERMGKAFYEQAEAVIEMLKCFEMETNVSVKSSCKYELPDTCVMRDSYDVDYMMRAVIENEASKENGFVYIIMQPQNAVLRHLLPGFCKNNKDIQVKHIVCMEKYADVGVKNSHLYNMEILKSLIPTVVNSNFGNYDVYYYYDHVASRSNAGLLLSNMILTSEYALCITPDRSYGVLESDPQRLKMYQELFEEHKKKCVSMFEYQEMAEWINTSNQQWENSDGRVYYMSSQPCMGVLNVSGELGRYTNPSFGVYAQVLGELLKSAEDWMDNKGNKHISYCSKKGLERFAREGLVDELPNGIYSPIGLEDRKSVLEKMIHAIEQESYELYLVDEEVMHLTPHLGLLVFGVDSINLRFQLDEGFYQLVLRENGLARIVYEVMEKMTKNPHVLSLKESLDYLKKLMMSLD